MVTINQLKNGLRVAIEEIPYVRSISFGIWVNNGSRNESRETNGMSHFIEHMMFKGTKDRSARDIAEEMDAVGGQINAYTTKEYTCYHTRVLDKHFEIALDVMSDMFLNSRFDDTDIQRERQVIVEEINMYDDAPEELVHDKLQEEIWSGSALGMPILGTEESIGAFNSNMMKEYLYRNYQPANTVISVAGNVNTESVMELLEKYFGGWSPERELEHFQDKTVYLPKVLKIERNIEQVHLVLAFQSFERDSEYKYVLSVLNTVFGGGMSSILFQRIREAHGLTYSIYSYLSSYLDTGLFAVYAGMSPGQTRKVIGLLFDEIRLLKETGIPEKVLAKTKEQIISNYIIGTESTVNRMTAAGGSVLVRNAVQTPEEIIEKIESITQEDIHFVIEHIFKPENISCSAVGNVGKFDFDKIIEEEKRKLV